MRRTEGVLVDAVSTGEIHRALVAGYAPHAAPGAATAADLPPAHPIVYTADIFDRESLDAVARHGIHVNCGSADMLEQLAERVPGASITLRVNPGFGHGHSQKTNTGGEGSKHGIWHEEIPDVLRRAEWAGLSVSGLHMHIGSGTDLAHLAEVAGALERVAIEIGRSLTTLAGALQPGQLDVRLSADRLILGANIIEGAALSAEAANRRFELMLNEGRLRSGSLKGRIAVTARTPGEIDVKGHASLERIEALTILEPFGVTRIRGQTTGALMLTGSGSSLPQLMETLEGRASVTVREGEIGGVDVDRIVSRGIVSALAMEGRTRFQSLVMQMRIGNGVATLHDSSIITLTNSAPLEGTINLSRQTSDVTARILPGGDPGRAMDTRLRIHGSWAKPVLMPD
ncbi:MAG: AsmA-like C-terminal region-containing protein, partial [Hyphomicrobiales bacterium]